MLLVTSVPMPRQDNEEEDANPQEPGFSTQTKADCNDGACHAYPDPQVTDSESDSNVEKKVDESTCMLA